MRGEQFPDFPESRGEVTGSCFEPCGDDGKGEKGGVFDLGGRKNEGAVMCRGENLDEFLSGIRAGADFAEELEIGADAEFFRGFAGRAGGVGFTGFEVSGGAGVPFGRLAVLPGAAFLQEQFAVPVEDEDVDGAVEELAVVDFSTGAGGDDIVIFVDHVELLAVVLRRDGGGGIEVAGEVDPERDGEVFGAASWGERMRGAPFLPWGGVDTEQGAELFAALAESALDQVVEEGGADGREWAGVAAFKQDESGIDTGFGEKDGGWEGAFAVHGPEALHSHGERAVVWGVGT